jgi:hypothetical protein
MKRVFSAVAKVLLLLALAGTLMGSDTSCNVKVDDNGLSIDQQDDSSSSDKFKDWIGSLLD